MGFQLMWSPAHVRHGRNIVENLKSANYDINSLLYIEMTKQKQNTMNKAVFCKLSKYMYHIMETNITQHIVLKEGNVCLTYIYLQLKTWYVPCTHTKEHVFT